VESYNNSPHRGLKNRSPTSISSKNQLAVWREGFIDAHNIKFKFNIGDHVRISKDKRLFEKGYYANWTEEYFKIDKRLTRSPPVYKLKDLANEDIKGIFYEAELQHVKSDYDTRISKVVRRRKGEALVKWKGWPEKFDSWIPLRDIKNI